MKQAFPHGILKFKLSEGLQSLNYPRVAKFKYTKISSDIFKHSHNLRLHFESCRHHTLALWSETIKYYNKNISKLFIDLLFPAC
jgi:hypothetical protein